MGGKSQAPLARYESGRRMPNLTNALRLSALLGVSVEALFKELYFKLKCESLKRKQKLDIWEKYG